MFEPENELERKLVAAATNVGERAAFMSALLDAEVFVAMFAAEPGGRIAEGDPPVIPAGTTLVIRSLVKDGAELLPFFTSPKRIRARTREAHIAVPDKARDLFARHQGVGFILNPNSEFGKEFLPEEIEAILDGRPSGEPKTWTPPPGAKMLIGVPADYPDEFVATLSQAFAAISEVDAAALAQASIAGHEPGLMLELVSSSARETLLAKVGPIIESARPPGRPIDVHVVAKLEALLSRNVAAPFYSRNKTRGFFGRLFLGNNP